MELAPQQVKAYDAVGAWLNDPAKQTFYLAGYAGTGKTTIAKRITDQLDGVKLYGAYTGKAASVLCRKGMDGRTLHSLVYKLVEPDQELVNSLKKRISECSSESLAGQLKKELVELSQPKFELNRNSELIDCDLLVVDEVSMVGEQLGADLLSFGCKVLVLGDPGQLPPVEGGGYFTAKQPDFCLTEIHRQAQGNPIINMATVVRKGGRLSYGAYGTSKVVNRRTVEAEGYDPSFDQYIVGLNRTRNKINPILRDKLGHLGSIPQAREKIICLRNNRERGLLNGTQWLVHSAVDKGTYVELEISNWDDPVDPQLGPKKFKVDAHHMDVNLKDMPMWDRRRAEEFTWGYAITCHKSQGSQWPRIFIQNESFAFREDASKWLYTALTRAEESVVVAL